MMARMALLSIALGMLWAAIGFLSFSAFSILSESFSPGAAAALTAGILFSLTGIGILIFWLSNRTIAVPLTLAQSGLAPPTPAFASELTELAKQHPLFAVTCAAALGVAAALSKRRPTE